MAQPQEESAEEFNRRAQAEQDAYMQQWRAEQAALQAQQSEPANDASADQTTSANEPEDPVISDTFEQTQADQAALPAETSRNEVIYDTGASAPADDSMGNLIFFGFVVIGIAVYLMPTIIAFSRKHRYKWPILAFNIGAGWSGIGWIWTLVWSVWPANSAMVDPLVGDAVGAERRQ